ncbi:cytochrome P450 [Mycena filopes]|nr:cytochrome P450 [Mycena filopes]
MSYLDHSLALWTLLSGLILHLLYCRATRSRLPLPPGPRKLPLVGNIFDMPPAFEWETYAEWGRKYDSDVIHLNLAGQSVVVLLSYTAMVDLLEKRSALYSDRPQLTMYFDLVGWNFNFALMRYGDKWRAHRRLFNQKFNQTGSVKFRPKEMIVTHTLLSRLLRTPDDFEHHLKLMAGELIVSATYGFHPQPVDDPYISLSERGIEAGTDAVIPGRFFVDTFPLLKHVPDWFPGAGLKRQAKEWRAVVEEFREVPFAEVKRQVASGTAPHSFTADCLQNLPVPASPDSRAQEKIIKATAASLYLAGSHTTLTVLLTFILAMLTNPAAQRRAQAEVDSVTGRARLPEFADEEAMPYVTALIREVLRWQPVLPMGLPHVLRVEDEYRGWRLPANTIFIPNVWSVFRDETMYPESAAFKPERFLTPDGKQLNPGVRDPQAAFGFGRRICPGRYLANSSIFILVSSILASFDIRKADGDNEATYEYMSGLLHAPLPFRCSIRPRSAEAVALIEEAIAAQDEVAL